MDIFELQDEPSPAFEIFKATQKFPVKFLFLSNDRTKIVICFYLHSLLRENVKSFANDPSAKRICEDLSIGTFKIYQKRIENV